MSENLSLSNTTNGFLYFLFYFLTFNSMILSILIYKIFQVMKQNFLIQTSGVICCFVSIILFLGWPLGSPHKISPFYCDIQALLLNYCFISIHAHFSFVMWNNLALAMGWKFFGIKDTNALVGLMFFISISVPIVPTIIIMAYNLDPPEINALDDSVFLTKYFFCVVNKPNWSGYRLWFILFSVPGIVAACILFYKTIESRRNMLQFNSTSQFSKLQLARMFFALIAYLLTSILSVILGFMAPTEGNNISFSDFMPAGVGFLLFITYGFGNTAIEFYKKVNIGLCETFGIERQDSRSSISSSRKFSATMSSPTRKSSIKSNSDSRNRRPSQLSGSVDENFIYDLSVSNMDESQENNKSIKRTQVRRGSEPIGQLSGKLVPKKKPIETILEDEEDNNLKDEG